VTDLLIGDARTPPLEQTTPRPATAAAPARLAFIDGLRGVAILMVLLYHGWVHTIRTPIHAAVGSWSLDLTYPLHYGYLGVHLFLVLSGFCLTYPLARGGAAGMRLQLGRFFQRRAWRILPPFYVALAAFAVVRVVEGLLMAALGRSGDAHDGVTAGQVLAHLFMVHNLSPAWLGTINGSFWSLALEWQLYLVFPLLVWGIRRWGLLPTLGAVLILTLTYRSWVFVTKDTTRMDVAYFYCYALPGRLFEFALGMMAAVLLARRTSAASVRWNGAVGLAALGLGALGLSVTNGWSPYSPVTDVIWGLAFFCLVMWAGRRSAGGGSWLEWRPLEALGIISYSVYLIHEPFIRAGYKLLGSRLPSPTVALLFFELAVVPLLIGLGWLFFRLVEARFIRMGKARAGAPPAGGSDGVVRQLEEMEPRVVEPSREAELVRS
jgi:peptidoglycan/LPS O-acetylase OafA/YrhL